jgi:hypothetical protein
VLSACASPALVRSVGVWGRPRAGGAHSGGAAPDISPGQVRRRRTPPRVEEISLTLSLSPAPEGDGIRRPFRARTTRNVFAHRQRAGPPAQRLPAIIPRASGAPGRSAAPGVRAPSPALVPAVGLWMCGGLSVVCGRPRPHWCLRQDCGKTLRRRRASGGAALDISPGQVRRRRTPPRVGVMRLTLASPGGGDGIRRPFRAPTTRNLCVTGVRWPTRRAEDRESAGG